MNYRRWAVVGFVGALAIFSFWHLSTAGSDYQFLTTSDSGFFYGIAREINYQDGMIKEYKLSHPPQGLTAGKEHQLQPLMLVTLYRGVHALNPSVSLMDVSRYFSPFLFALAVIGAFLAARELGGDLAGCGSALFTSTLVGSIYWTKIGAFDREITLIFFGTWIFYLLLKIFRAKGMDILKYSVLGGLLYGLFLLTWPGAPYIGVIVGLALFLIILEKAISGLGLISVSIVLFATGTAFDAFNVAWLIGIFTFLAGLVKVGMNWEDLKSFESNVISAIRSNLKMIGGVLVLGGVTTVVAVFLGGYSLDFWVKMFAERIPGFLGTGGGGVSFPTIATEMQPAPAALGGYFGVLSNKLYGNTFLTGLTVFLVGAGVVKTFWKSERRELVAFSFLVIVSPMMIDKSRFVRLFWPMWPILAGFGIGALLGLVKKTTFSPIFSVSSWMEKVRQPLVLALVFIFLVTPFIQNARANRHTSETAPWPHGGSLPGGYYHSLLDSFSWIENENHTPENSTFVIPWSYGHFAIGATNRASVTDGINTAGWVGEWQDSPGVKPPDYIKDVIRGTGVMYGKNYPYRENKVNGRRPDVQRLYGLSDENKFAFIVSLYKKYDVNMDYIIFNNYWGRNMSARRSYLTSWLQNLGKEMETTFSVGYDNVEQYYARIDEVDIIFRFDEENIRYDFRGAPLNQAGEELGGVIYENADSGKIINYSFSRSPDESKILWLNISGNPGILRISQKLWIQNAGLKEYNSSDLPMLVRALDNYSMPGYLREVYRTKLYSSPVYRTSHAQAVVYKIDYSKIYKAVTPNLKSPSEETSDNIDTPVFEWSETVGAIKYELSVDNEPSFSSPLTYHVENLSETQHKISSESALRDDKYYWRVRAFDEDENPSGWSRQNFIVDTAPPMNPALISPADGTSTKENTISFEWSEVSDNSVFTTDFSGLQHYRIQVDNDKDFSSPEIQKKTVDNFYTPVKDFAGNNYWWRVRAVDEAGNKSVWSESWSFYLQD